MGYESYGDGIVTVREHYDIEYTRHTLEEYGFEIVDMFKNKIELGFCGFRLYNCKEELEFLTSTCNGKIEITGDSVDDRWILSFHKGEIFISRGEIVFGEPELTTLDEVI